MALPEARPRPLTAPPSGLVGYAFTHYLKVQNANPWGRMMMVWSLLGAALVVLIVVDLAFRASGVPFRTGIVVWALAIVAGAWLLVWIARRAWATRDGGPRGLYDPDETRRVWCILHPVDRPRLDACGPIEDVAFEPEVFPAPFALRPTAWMWAAWAAASLVALAALAAAMPVGTGRFPATRINILVVYGAMALGWIAMTLGWPTSVRIVPGRVDIIRGFFLSHTRGVVRSMDLRGRRVTVDLRSGHVITRGPGEGEQDDAALVAGPWRIRIAHALLLAAVSSAEPAPLPETEVVG